MIENIAARSAGSILAVDADPNSSLPDLLGVKDPETIVGIVEDISKNMDKIPHGVTKDRFIEMRVHQTLTEGKDYDLMVMGRPEGPGCYCYVNNLLRDLIGKITKTYDFVVIDNAAGMEHISRRTMRRIDKLVLVSDCSVMGIRSSKRIYDLAVELGIKIGEVFLVVNKVTDSTEGLDDEIRKSALTLAGVVPHSEPLKRISISNTPISGLKDKNITDSVNKIWSRICR